MQRQISDIPKHKGSLQSTIIRFNRTQTKFTYEVNIVLEFTVNTYLNTSLYFHFRKLINNPKPLT